VTAGENGLPKPKKAKPYSAELTKYLGEDKLRQCAKAIPAQTNEDEVPQVEKLINKTCTATLDFLKTILAARYLAEPLMTSNLMASTARADIQPPVDEVGLQHWVPVYPVYGYITVKHESYPILMCTTPLVPAMVLMVNREQCYLNLPDYILHVSVSGERDLYALYNLLVDLGDAWERFEREFNILARDHLSGMDCENHKGKRLSCHKYLEMFIKDVVQKLPEDDKCFETFELEFAISDDHGLHGSVQAAISLLKALLYYQAIPPHVMPDKDDMRVLRTIINSATDAGMESRMLQKAE
jgi:hypothetical protein